MLQLLLVYWQIGKSRKTWSISEVPNTSEYLLSPPTAGPQQTRDIEPELLKCWPTVCHAGSAFN